MARDVYKRQLNGHGGPQDGKLLDAVVHLGLLAHTGGVDEQVLALLVLKIAVQMCIRDRMTAM